MMKTKQKRENKIKSTFKGNIGMFLVCVEFSKRNFIALPTSRNTKGYDVIVLNPETNKSIGVQVKCTDTPQRYKGWPIMNTHWKDYKEKIEEKILCDFIFVDISNIDKPQYFIVSKEDIKDILINTINGYLDKYKEKHKLTYEEMIEKEKKEHRRPNLWALNINHIEEYKDKWNIIINRLD